MLKRHSSHSWWLGKISKICTVLEGWGGETNYYAVITVLAESPQVWIKNPVCPVPDEIETLKKRPRDQDQSPALLDIGPPSPTGIEGRGGVGWGECERGIQFVWLFHKLRIYWTGLSCTTASAVCREWSWNQDIISLELKLCGGKKTHHVVVRGQRSEWADRLETTERQQELK